MRAKLILFAGILGAAALTIGIGVALGTPGSGASSSYVARGTVGDQLIVGMPNSVTVSRTVRIKTKRGVVTGRVKLKVPGVGALISCGSAACVTLFQVLTIGPGGFTGWHTHPGPTFVAVEQGEGTMYRAASAGCTGVKYGTASGFLQPSTEVHNMRNEGSTPLVLHAFYILPAGTQDTAVRVDQAQPGNCPAIP
jgi:mannose-6-phosphate isomerase-like protein (cupin superfamily)